MPGLRPVAALAAVAAAAAAVALGAGGCGSRFPLPNEVARGREVPTDKSYQMVATWSGMDGVTDILLTQGSGSQLFILFNHGGAGVGPRGSVHAYPLKGRPPTPAPLPGFPFPTLFNPVALASGGGRVFVLDQGDTALARDPLTRQITDLGLYWRVRIYDLLGTDTVSTFTDTTMAFVRGVAADAAGNVYVSGIAIILVPDPNDARIRTRTFQSRIYRYRPGPRYPGVVPGDRFMPGAHWHRDSTWVIEEGSGIGSINDARGLFWSAAGGPAVYAADFGKNWIQKLSDRIAGEGAYQLDGGFTGTPFVGPEDVAVDLQGFLYIADVGNRRVVRYGPEPTYIQKVNIERDAFGDTLDTPVAVAADDSLVYVGDRASGRVVRYQRRK